MKMKKIYMGILLSLMMMLMAGIASANTITCDFLNASTTVGSELTYFKGSVNVAINLTVFGEGVNATVGILSVDAGAISGGATFIVVNKTLGNQSQFNFTVVSTEMLDDSVTTFTLTVKNGTQKTLTPTGCTRTFISDNSVPELTLQTPADLDKNKTGEILFSYSAVNTSSCILYLEGSPHTMTESSDVCSITIKSLPNGFTSWYITSSDGLNVTTSATTQVQISKPGGMILDAQGQPVAGTPTASIVPGNALQRMVDVIKNFLASILSVFQRG